MDTPGTIKYYREKLGTIHTIGQRNKLKSSRQARQVTEEDEAVPIDKRNDHQDFLHLMAFINKYKDSLCQDGNDILNVNSRLRDNEDEYEKKQRA